MPSLEDGCPPGTTYPRWVTFACRVRRLFDRLATRLPFGAVVVLLFVAAGVLGKLEMRVFRGSCDPPPISLIRLEVTFSGPRFAALLAAEGGCRSAVKTSFLWDILFSLVYPFALAALYVWVERWRRTDPFDRPAQELELDRRSHFFVVAPFIAGVLDAFVENIPLWLAALAVGGRTGATLRAWSGALVVLGSLAGTAKWVLLLLWGWGTAAELLRGPRGDVLRRIRFSALAVVLGALPLLAVAQGQDILQRLVEGTDFVPARIAFSLVALLVDAVAVWYGARSLVRLRFDDDDRPPSPWYPYFAEHLPRDLGVMILALSGLAFARAGLAQMRFLVVALVGFLVVVLVERYAPVVAEAMTRTLLPTRFQVIEDKSFVTRGGGAVLSAVLSALVVWPHWLPGEARGSFDFEEVGIRRLRIAAACCLVLAWLFYLFVSYRRDFMAARRMRRKSFQEHFRRLEAEASREIDARHVPARLRTSVAILLAASLAFLLVFTGWPVKAGRVLGPLWVLALFVANAVFFGSLVVWVNGRYRLPVVRLALALALLFGLWNDNHAVRPVPKPGVPSREHLEPALRRWLDSLPPTAAGKRSPVILVAAAGGGLRAAYWMAAALAAAQDENPAFARHVFAISGVSGGSLGAALFVALHHDGGDSLAGLPCAGQTTQRTTVPARGPYTRCVRRFLHDDFLAPVLSMAVAPDFTQRFLPFPVMAFDRSRGLEEAWKDSYRDATRNRTFSEGLVALATPDAKRPRSPMLFLSATHVESGKRYVAAPVVFDSVLRDARDVVQLLGADLPLAGAVHNSARFTYISPAGHLERNDGEERGRVVDGGYFENSGLATAAELYALVRRVADDATLRRPLDVLVVYLCNDPVACARETARDSAVADSTAKVHSTWANELLAPVRAVLAARDARGALARAQLRGALDTTQLGRAVAGAQLRDALGDRFLQLNVCDRLPPRPSQVLSGRAGAADSSRILRSRERVVSPPLGWSLSDLARDWMDRSLEPPTNTSAAGCAAANAALLKQLTEILRAADATAPAPTMTPAAKGPS